MRTRCGLAVVIAGLAAVRGVVVRDTPDLGTSRRYLTRPDARPPEQRGLHGEVPFLAARQGTASPTSSTTAPVETPSPPSPIPSTTSTSTSGLGAIPAAPSSIPLAPPSPVPLPMDLQVSYSLSVPCLSYLSGLLNSPLFLSCLPFSLLSTTSTSFAALLTASAASGNYTALNSLVAYVTAPQPSGAECDEYMAEAYARIADKGNCGPDIAARKAAAAEARQGLGTAGLMRHAAALRNPDSGKWCYLEAVASERPDDLYLWSVAAGIALPPSTKPTCSKCSSLLLNQYASALTSTPALNATLVSAAVHTVNTVCGQGFVSYAASSMGASSAALPVRTRPFGTGWGGLGVCVLAAVTGLVTAMVGI